MIIIDMQQLWLYMDDLMGKGLEWSVIMEFMFLISANWVPFALPLSILLASIMTFGNLAESNELTAMKAAGMSIFRIMRPLLVIVVGLSAFAFYFSNNLLPMANFKMRVLYADIQQTKGAIMLDEGVFYNDLDDYRIRVSKKHEDGLLEDVLIYDHTEVRARGALVSDPRDYKRTIRAKYGEMKQSEDKSYIQLDLKEGVILQEMDPNSFEDAMYPYMRYEFDETSLRFEVSGFNLEHTDEDMYEKETFYYTFGQLSDVRDSAIHDMRNNAKNVERYVKQTFPITRQYTDTTRNIKELPSPSISYFEKLSPEDQKRNITSALTRVSNAVKTTDTHANRWLKGIGYLNEIKVEAHRKFTLSFAVLMLFFLGAPLGAIVRKGGIGWPVVIAILLFLVYFLLTRAGYEMAQEGTMDAFIGSWLSALVLTPVAIFVFIKANNDSKIFDKEFYLKLIKRITFRK